MSTTNAYLIEKVVASEVSEDGKHALIHVENGGAAQVLAFPVDQLNQLMTIISSAYGVAGKIQQSDKNLKHVFPVEWWEFDRHENNIVLTFRLPGGMELSFAVDQNAAAHMREVLSVLTGNQVQVAPGSSVQ